MCFKKFQTFTFIDTFLNFSQKSQKCDFRKDLLIPSVIQNVENVCTQNETLKCFQVYVRYLQGHAILVQQGFNLNYFYQVQISLFIFLFDFACASRPGISRRKSEFLVRKILSTLKFFKAYSPHPQDDAILTYQGFILNSFYQA